ncbi:MAG: hypothetical protein ACD_39C01827G0001, partial [uncultured bacterium]
MTRIAFFSCFAVLCCLFLLTAPVNASEAFGFVHNFSVAGDVQPTHWRLKLEFK